MIEINTTYESKSTLIYNLKAAYSHDIYNDYNYYGH
jgi:hypothetical protein